MDEPLVIVGLGNPGREYEKTRHNFGFLLADSLCGPAARWRDHGGGLWCEIQVCGRKTCLLKPQRYMNVSGPVVRSFLDYYHYSASQLLVVHDDLDLPLGGMRFRANGGDGGHNGIRSIVSSLGSGDFCRLKLGIGRPVVAPEVLSANPGISERLVTDWVLGKFSKEEVGIVEQCVSRAILGIEDFAQNGILTAQNRFNS